MKHKYLYFKYGANIFRIPSDFLNDKNPNINLIENLVWNSPKQYEFVRNELSYSLGENVNFSGLDFSESLETLISVEQIDNLKIANEYLELFKKIYFDKLFQNSAQYSHIYAQVAPKNLYSKSLKWEVVDDDSTKKIVKKESKKNSVAHLGLSK